MKEHYLHGFDDKKAPKEAYLHGYRKDAKSKALKMYTSPTGSKHRIGSRKHQYWANIIKRGEDNKRAGVPND